MKTFDPSSAAGRDVVLFAPHPDDEAVGPGGTAHLLVKAGARVHVVVVANGQHGITGDAEPEQREAESNRCCEILGTLPPLFARLGSSCLRDDPVAAGGQVAELLGDRRADIVLVPSPLERHATHRATLLAALFANVARPGAAWWGYGVWDEIPPVADCAEVDVTQARAVKTRAIAAHVSQNGGRSIAAGVAARDMSQAIFSRITGEETRKALERWLCLDGLAPLPAGTGDAQAASRHVAAWLTARHAEWIAERWGPGAP